MPSIRDVPPPAEPTPPAGEPSTTRLASTAPPAEPTPPRAQPSTRARPGATSPLVAAVVKKAHHPRLDAPTSSTGDPAPSPTSGTAAPPTTPTAASATTAPTPVPAKAAADAAKPAADAAATLAVAIAPWCDLTVDGNPRGRSPTTLSLPPGRHHLVCVNPVSQQRLTREVILAPAEHRDLRERLYATVRVTPRLVRGDAFAVDGGKPASASSDVEPGRRRVTLYKGGAPVETRWLDVPPGGCTLVDAPQLACDKP